MGIEDIKRTARGALHEFMGRSAFYYETPASPPVATKARPHSRRGQIGDLPGTNLNYAETFDRKETVVLWREDIPAPARGGLIHMATGEGFWIDSVEPPDGQTITVNVNKATEAELAGLTPPEA